LWNTVTGLGGNRPVIAMTLAPSWAGTTFMRLVAIA
jgi:hypothetical protein